MAHLREKRVPPDLPLPILLLGDELIEKMGAHEMARSVPTLPSGMELEEEKEKHTMAEVIPTREVELRVDSITKKKKIKAPKAYIKWNGEIPGHMRSWKPPHQIEYDLDRHDIEWFNQYKQEHPDTTLTEDMMELMMDAMEKEVGGLRTVPLEKLSLPAKEDVIIAVWEHWKDRRKKQPLFDRYFPVPKHDDGRWWVPFRPREKDLLSRRLKKEANMLEKMKVLHKEMIQARALVETVHNRERLKWERCHLLLDIVDSQQSYYATVARIAKTRPRTTERRDRHRKYAAIPGISPYYSYDLETENPSSEEEYDVPTDNPYRRQPGKFLLPRNTDLHPVLEPFDDLVPVSGAVKVFDLGQTKSPPARRLVAFGLRGRIGRGGRYIIDRPRLPLSSSVRMCIPLPWDSKSQSEGSVQQNEVRKGLPVDVLNRLWVNHPASQDMPPPNEKRRRVSTSFA